MRFGLPSSPIWASNWPPLTLDTPLGSGDPLGSRGTIEASQRGLDTGVLYFRIDEPAFGSVLYFQNLTAMNDYYLATDTKPDDGGSEDASIAFMSAAMPDGTGPASLR